MKHKVKIKNISDCEKELSIEIPRVEIDKRMSDYFTEMAKEVKMPGFRTGKVPMQIVKTRFAGEVTQKVVSRLVEESYVQALAENKIVPVSEPKVNAAQLEDGKPFNFTAVVEIKPQVVLKAYKGLALKKDKIKVDKKEIDAKLEEHRQSKSQLKALEKGRPVADKDFVVMDFLGKLDGKPFPGGDAKNFLYEMGSKRFVPGFEEGLLSMNVSDKKEIPVTFPKDYQEKKLAGKKVIFHVDLKEIKSKSVPKLDDALAKEFDGCKTIADLKQKVTDEIKKQHQQRVDKKCEQDLLDLLVKKNDLTPPPSMVSRQHTFLADDSKSRLKQMGLQGPQLDETLKKWDSELKDKAKFDVKVMLLLDAIGEKEKLEVGDKDLDQRLSEIAEQAKAPKAHVEKHYKEKGMISQIKWQIRQQKTVDFLLAQAKVSEK